MKHICDNGEPLNVREALKILFVVMSRFCKLRFIDLIVGEPLKREEARVPPSETKSSSREGCSLPERLGREFISSFHLDANKYVKWYLEIVSLFHHCV